MDRDYLPESIYISDDNLCIMVKAGKLSIDEEALVEYLDSIKVKGLLHRDRISSLYKTGKNGVVDRTVIIAEAPAALRASSKIAVELGTLREWELLYPDFTEAGLFLKNIKDDKEDEKGHPAPTGFVKSGEFFLSIKVSSMGEDLFGQNRLPEKVRPVRYNSSCIKEDAYEEEILYYAEKTGYLVYRNGIISIETPVFDVDKFKRNYIFYPTFQQDSDVMDYYLNAVNAHREKHPSAPVFFPDKAEMANDENYGGVHIEPISRGVEPVEGRDAVIKIFVSEGTPGDNVDLKEFRHYITVRKDEIIAEKTYRVEGVEGIDIYGNIISVRDGKDNFLKHNELIVEFQEEKKSLFKAATDGVLKIKENAVKLSEAMIIPGNVDYSTGNINYSKDVYVTKDIKPNFKVFSDGDIIVKGSIEEGADIRAKGNLLVEGGIVGDKTKIFAEGDASVKFIQDADVYVGGELLVKTSIMGGSIFAGQALIVSGKKGSKRSQVFGGEYYSFCRMELPSVGSPYKNTKLCCGYNPRVERMIQTADDTLKSIELNMSQLINGIGFNIKSPFAKRKIKNLTPTEKKALKEKLTEIKQLSRRYSELEKGKSQLIDRLYSTDIESLEINIREMMVPDTTVVFIKTSMEIRRDIGACRISLDDEGINILPASKIQTQKS